MRICLPALIALGLLLAVACDPNDEESVNTPAATASLLDLVAEAMDDASFRLEFTSNPVGNPLDTQSGRLDWVNEDLFFAAQTYVDGRREDECDSGTDESGGEYQYCMPILVEVENEYTMEGVYTEKGIYFRSCEGDECGGWGFVAKDDRTGLFLGAYADIVVIMLRDLLGDPITPSEPEEDGGLIHVRAGFNPARMAFESEKRFAETFGEDEFGQYCYSGGELPIVIDGDQPEEVETPQSGCESYTLEEYEDANQSLFEQWDNDPAFFDIWIEPADFTISRLVFDSPEVALIGPGERDYPPGFGSFNPITHTEMTFSDFGDVTVEIPKLDLD